MSVEGDVLADFLGMPRNSREMAEFVYDAQQLLNLRGAVS